MTYNFLVKCVPSGTPVFYPAKKKKVGFRSDWDLLLVPLGAQQVGFQFLMQDARGARWHSWASRHHPFKVLCWAQGLHKRIID